jgi:hypothetical protein
MALVPHASAFEFRETPVCDVISTILIAPKACAHGVAPAVDVRQH